jgi:hypothetical protein
VVRSCPLLTARVLEYGAEMGPTFGRQAPFLSSEATGLGGSPGGLYWIVSWERKRRGLMWGASCKEMAASGEPLPLMKRGRPLANCRQ